MPVYDFAQNKAIPGEFETLEARPIVLLEGIMALH